MADEAQTESASEPEKQAAPVVPAASTKFEVKSFIDTDKLRTDLAYSPANLTDAMMQQASMFAFYGITAAQASRQVNSVKMLLETTEATVYRILRDRAVAAGEKITEASLEKQVQRQPRVTDLKRALNEAKQVEDICKTAVEAFRHRRDMLVQQGLLHREEMKGELSIQEKNARNQAFQDQTDQVLARRRERAESH